MVLFLYAIAWTALCRSWLVVNGVIVLDCCDVVEGVDVRFSEISCVGRRVRIL